MKLEDKLLNKQSNSSKDIDNKGKNSYLSLEKNKNNLKNEGDMYKLPPPPIENVIFGGGGAAAFAYFGTIITLNDYKLLKSIKRLGGTSAGGIAMLLVGLGLSVSQIKKLSEKVDFNEFKDPEPSILRKFWGLRNLKDIIDLIDNLGIYKGDKMLNWARYATFLAVGNPDVTFAELEKLKEINPDIREMTFVAYNISTNRMQYFNVHETPNVRVADALRASASFPGAFLPYKIKVNGKYGYFIDGGLVDNYLISYFDKDRYYHSSYILKKTSNMCSLGFRVQEHTKMHDALEKVQKIPDNKRISYIQSILDAPYAREEHDINTKYNGNTINLGKHHPTLDFNLTPEKRKKLTEIGAKHTKAYILKNHNENSFVNRTEKEITLRPEKRISKSVTVEFLLALRFQLYVSIAKHLIEGRSKNSVYVTSDKKRIEDIEKNYKIIKKFPNGNLPKITKEEIKSALKEIMEEERKKENKVYEALKEVDKRFNVLKLDSNKIISDVLKKELGIKGSLSLLEVLSSVNSSELLKSVINGETKDGNNIINLAITYDNDNIVEELLKIEKNNKVKGLKSNIINLRPTSGATPLHIAAASGSCKLVKKLYNLGAKVDDAGPKGESALIVAARKKQEKVISLLLKLRANNRFYWSKEKITLTRQDIHGYSCFHYIVENNLLNACKNYIEAVNNHNFGGYITYTSIKDNNKNTPLHIISKKNLVSLWDIIEKTSKWKIKDTLDLNAKNSNGKTPLKIAIESGNKEIAEKLIDAGASTLEFFVMQKGKNNSIEKKFLNKKEILDKFFPEHKVINKTVYSNLNMAL